MEHKKQQPLLPSLILDWPSAYRIALTMLSGHSFVGLRNEAEIGIIEIYDSTPRECSGEALCRVQSKEYINMS